MNSGRTLTFALVFSFCAPMRATSATCGPCPNASFGPAIHVVGVNFFTGVPNRIVGADFNGDGIPDLAVASAYTLSVFLGRGGGDYSDRVDTPLSNFSFTIFVADVNEDGFPDLVVGRTDGFQVLLGAGTGYFLPLSVHAGNVYPIGVADFDHDGHVDIAAQDFGGQAIALLRGDGKGGFAQAGSFPAGLVPGTTAAVADFNRDGLPDLVVSGNSSGFAVLLSTGAGFAAPRVFASQGLGWVATGDVTGDGNPDVITMDGYGSVYVYPGDGSGNFSTPTFIDMGWSASQLVVGDLDGDGKADLVATNYGTGHLLIRRSLGGSNFAPLIEQAVGAAPGPTVILDLDGDGLPDVAIVAGGTAQVLSGDGAGGFLTAQLPSVAANAFVAVADFDGDGFLDIAAVGTFPSSGLSVRYGDGAGGLSSEVIYATSQTGGPIVAADFNGDGRPDLAVDEYGGVRIFLNDGTGAFGPSTLVGTCGPLSGIGDFNNDSKLDLVVPCSNSVMVLFGDGNGGFPTSTSISLYSYGLAVGDFDGDGKLDLVTIYFNTLTVFLGDGAGHFGPPIVSTNATSGFGQLLVGDFDGDGHLDVAFSDGGSVRLLVLAPGTGTGAFGPLKTFAMTSDRLLLARDLNGDGFPDIVATTYSAIEIRMNDGSGGFLPPRFFAGGAGTHGISSGDLNRDGLVDLVLGNPDFTGPLTVLLNTSCKPRRLFAPPVRACSPPGSAFSPSPVVRVVDDGGNVISCDSGTVSATLLSGPSGGTLSGTLSAPVVAGVATFGNLVPSLAGTYRTRFVHSGPARSSEMTLHAGATASVSIAGPAAVCGTATAAYDAGAGYSNYTWTLDGLPISFQQTASVGFLSAGPHTLAVRVMQNSCEAETSATISNAPPQVSSVSPPNGPAGGGTPVVVSGTCFAAGATLTLGGTLATSPNTLNSSSLAATTAGHAPGGVDVVVTNPDGQSGTKTNGYSYECTGSTGVAVGGSTTICSGTSVFLTLSLTGQPPWTVTWSDGEIEIFYTSPGLRYVAPTVTTTYSVTSVVGNFCPGTATGSATVTVQNCPPGSPAGSLIPDGRALSDTMRPAGNIYTVQASAFGSSYLVEVEPLAVGSTTLLGGGPAPLVSVTRSGGTPLGEPIAARETCSPAAAGRLWFYPGSYDLAAGPLEIHISDALSSGYPFRVRVTETTLFAPRWSINGYRAFLDLQNTSDCTIGGIIYQADEQGVIWDYYSFELSPGGGLQQSLSSHFSRTGSIRIIHNAPTGGLVGGVYMVSPAGGQTFRWPLQEVRSYGASDGK